MKKKLLFLLIIMISFLFVKNVDAKTCKYKLNKAVLKENGAKSYKNITEFTMEASGEITFTSDLGKEKQFNFKYKCKKNKDNPCDINIDNWSDGTLQNDFGIATTAGDFVAGSLEEPACPGAVMVRTGTWCSGAGYDAFILHTKSDAQKVLDGYVQKGRWKRKSYLYIMEYIPTQEEVEKKEQDTYTSCKSFSSPQGTKAKKYLDGCLTNEQYSCVWVKKKIKGRDNPVEYCNFDSLTYVGCGKAWDLPDKLPGIISFIVNLAKIATPIILVLVSIISLVKAVASSKEEDIKKAQNTLIRRLIAAAIVFFVIQMTQFVMLKVADSSEGTSIKSCLNCFLNNSCGPNRYYKTMEGGKYICTNLDGSKFTGICH